jgi:uncharacterized membrane protein YphA (DoxX/SURF4 family)
MSTKSQPRWQSAILVVARIALGYLFFTQLFWKFPPSFGCPADFTFTTGSLQSGQVRLQRTSGLCDWIGIESVWAKQPRPFFVADLRPIGGPTLSIGLGWIARLNGFFLDKVVIPNLRWFGWLLWGMEAFATVSLLLGLLSRLGGLAALGVSAQLMIGLAGITNPYEWEWSYIQMVVLSLLMFSLAPGRFVGIDALLRPRLEGAAAKGSRFARILLLLT